MRACVSKFTTDTTFLLAGELIIIMVWGGQQSVISGHSEGEIYSGGVIEATLGVHCWFDGGCAPMP